MRKATFTLASTLVVISISFPTIAFADDQDDGSSSSEDVNVTHVELEEIYEDFNGVVIPPVAVRVQIAKDPNIFVLPIRPVQDNASEAKKTLVFDMEPASSSHASNLPELLKSPSRHEPIQVSNINLSQVTPTDEFVSSASVFGETLAIAGVLFFGLIGANSFANRRKLKSASAKSSKP